MTHPISGPMPIRRLRELALAPFGTAAREIQGYDPAYQRLGDGPTRWMVTAIRQVTQKGVYFVQAASQEEAEDIVWKLPEDVAEWTVCPGAFYSLAISGCLPAEDSVEIDERQLSLFGAAA